MATAFAALAALCVVVAPHDARAADPKEAARDFNRGEDAFKRGDFRRAGEEFEKAYAASPHYSPLWNAARAWEKAGELAHAANLYARYLREAPPDARDRDRATKALEALSQKLARIEVHAPGLEGLTLDDAEVDEGAVVYVAPGDHVVSARAGDAVVRKTQHADAGENVSVALVPPPPEPSPAKVAPPAPEPPRAPEHHGWSPVVVAFGGALTAALGGLAIWSGLDTLGQKDTFDQHPTQDNLDSGRAKEQRTNLLIGGAAGVFVLTAACAIFLVDWGGKKTETGGAPQTAYVGLGFGPGSFALRGGF